MNDTVTVDANGNWNYQVPTNLAPGTYKITLKGLDVNGNPVEKPYSFTVYSSASVSNPLPDTGIPVQGLLIGFSLVLFLLCYWYLKKLTNKSFEEKIINT
jgi:hypothetical protein